MKKVTCTLTSAVVVTTSAGLGFYLLSRPLLRMLGISEYANGVALIGLLAVCIVCVMAGAFIGIFLFPLVLRSFCSPSDFWGWLGSTPGMALPYLDRLLERWMMLLYGPRPVAHGRKNH